MEEVFGLYHQLQLSAMDFHDPAASAAGLGLESLMKVARAPGYVLSSCSASAVPAVSEASVAVESRGYAAAGTMVVGAGGEGQPTAGDEAVSGTSTTIKAKIASHPLYPRLLEAYIDCHKVGAPPEVASLLDEVLRENGGANKRNVIASASFSGDDPELDHFMATYCDMLVKYRSDITRPLDEAATFLSGMEVQLSNLCSRGSCSVSDEAARYSEEEFSGGDIEMDICDSHMQTEDRELKERLLRKYSGYLGSLKQEFSKKKKKGKLPKTSRQTLLDWWTAHYKWPYPTEGDKIALAEATGLSTKQINNWFINQRKRHWKTTENMPFSLMEGLPAPFYLND